MNPMTKIYKSKFKEALNPYGFKLYRKTFYRSVNDVVQMMMLKSRSGEYTIEFEVHPLCLWGGDLHCDGSGEGIHLFRGDGPISLDYWYDICTFTGRKLSDEEIEKVVDEMLSVVLENVMPIFERRKVWESWLKETTIWEQAAYGSWINIKTGNYEKAISFLQGRLEKLQKSFPKVDPNDPYQLEKRANMGIIKKENIDEIRKRYIAAEKRTQESIIDLTKRIEMLTSSNKEYFDNAFAEQEANSREFLDDPNKFKKKYGYS